MLTYNSQLKKLVLPEYGRNIQQMVDHCVDIEDRDERTRCAFTIVQNMANIFPQLRAETDYQHKLWDHLMIMSGFRLDVDFPFDDIIREESLDTKPEPIQYELEPIKFRHYGKNIERMIERAATYPEGDERDALVMLLAMPKSSRTWPTTAMVSSGSTPRHIACTSTRLSSPHSLPAKRKRRNKAPSLSIE